MRALVTGATGFIGGHLVERLRADGWSVAALVRPGGDVAQLEELGVDLIRGDVADREALRQAARDCATAFHLAGARTSTTADPEAFHRVNVVGTENVLAASLEAGVQRFVLASTTGVHGSGDGRPIDESAPLRPDTPYRVSRLDAERATVAFGRSHGLPIVRARITAVYGPRNRDFLPLFRDVAGGRFTLAGSGDQRFHLSYVADVVEGLVRCAGSRAAPGEAYIVGSSTIPTLWELVAAIAAAAGVSARRRPWLGPALRAATRLHYRAFRPLGIDVGVLHAAAFLTHPRAFDLGKARRELDLSAGVPFAAAVQATVDWYRRHGDV